MRLRLSLWIKIDWHMLFVARHVTVGNVTSLKDPFSRKYTRLSVLQKFTEKVTDHSFFLPDLVVKHNLAWPATKAIFPLALRAFVLCEYESLYYSDLPGVKKAHKWGIKFSKSSQLQIGNSVWVVGSSVLAGTSPLKYIFFSKWPHLLSSMGPY